MLKTSKAADAHVELTLKADYLENHPRKQLEVEISLRNLSKKSVFIWRSPDGHIGMIATTAKAGSNKGSVFTLLLVSSEIEVNEEEAELPEFYELKPEQVYKQTFKTDLLDFLAAEVINVRMQLIYTLHNDMEVVSDLKNTDSARAEKLLHHTQQRLATPYINIRH